MAFNPSSPVQGLKTTSLPPTPIPKPIVAPGGSQGPSGGVPGQGAKGTMEVPVHDVYQDGTKGPFRCDNCEHFKAPNQCNQPEIIQLRKGVVTPDACCDYFDSLSGKGPAGKTINTSIGLSKPPGPAQGPAPMAPLGGQP